MSTLNQSNFPATLNGCVVLGSFILPHRNGVKGSRIIFIDRGREIEERYVIAIQCVNEDWWIQSVYYFDRNEALDSFLKVIKLNYK